MFQMHERKDVSSVMKSWVNLRGSTVDSVMKTMLSSLATKNTAVLCHFATSLCQP